MPWLVKKVGQEVLLKIRDMMNFLKISNLTEKNKAITRTSGCKKLSKLCSNPLRGNIDNRNLILNLLLHQRLLT